MFYPLKFKPVYKDYIWGGRSFEKLGRILPEGRVAESWEVSCHPDGVSVVSYGEFEGRTLTEVISEYGRKIVGNGLSQQDVDKFPLLVKLIDANDKLSVQVHPEDSYAQIHENGELGKNEMWYIVSAKPGSKLIYDVVPGTTRESFAQAVKESRIESCLKYVEVSAGDVLNIPAGLVHAIGDGIVLAEVQQNSNTTYRVYDYDRTDKNGNKRPLHIDKALEVIDFNTQNRHEKTRGLEMKLGPSCTKTYKVANRYFSAELYKIDGSVRETADGSRFYIYTFTDGEGRIQYGKSDSTTFKTGESILIPASMGTYSIIGSFNALKAYVPHIEKNILTPLIEAGYSLEEIYNDVCGLR